MLNLTCKTIPHKKHRYPTVGDYWTDRKGVDQFRVSNMKNTDYEFLVLIHELIESFLCKKRGITNAQIDAFDIQYEREREQGLHKNDEEPGCDEKAPYHKEHMAAMRVERLVARWLKVDWATYDKTIMEL